MKTSDPQGSSQGIERESWLKPHPGFRLRKILVPVDFSEPSKKALQYAVSMAEEFGAEVILLHVVEPYPLIPEMPAATAEMQELWRKEGQDGLERWKRSVKEAECATILRAGNPARMIVAEAVETQADLIVLGTHGRSGLAHFFLGSVAERVVQTAPCPVLTVRERESDFLKVYSDTASLQNIGKKRESIPTVQTAEK